MKELAIVCLVGLVAILSIPVMHLLTDIFEKWWWLNNWGS